LIYRRVPAGVRRARALKTLETVGLKGWESHTPGELSGGQQQRVAIARAIVTEPSVLFADEPTGNLDTARSREIMDLLSGLNRDRGITIVMVTHDRIWQPMRSVSSISWTVLLRWISKTGGQHNVVDHDCTGLA